MKYFRFVLVLLCPVFLTGLAQPIARAQQAGTTPPTLRMGRYDKSTEVVLSGTIQSVHARNNSTNLPPGTYLTLSSPPLMVNVHMGIFSVSSIPFRAGDQVSVTGSLITLNGAQVLLARQVQSSNQTLTVRSSKGFVLRARPINPAQGGLQ